jgi:Amt family ammonium transporter
MAVILAITVLTMQLSYGAAFAGDAAGGATGNAAVNSAGGAVGDTVGGPTPGASASAPTAHAIAPSASATPASAKVINSGDTAWMLISTALVMLMTPGLGLFYGGMVRRKNVLGTIMQSFAMLCMISVIWVLWGYTLAFGPDHWGLIGGLDWLGLNGVGQEPSDYAPTIPHLVFMMFQGMFAVITPALITGAFAERMKFSALLVFSALWLTFVYAPVCHWVWGGGWIGATLGALDFAGGTVVHINSAVAAITAVWIIGKRKGFGRTPMPPHNVTMTIMGGALLWFGWFGFNAGSALTSGGLAALAFVTTNTASAAAAMAWMFAEWMHRGKPTALGAVSGAVAGLVAITPAAGFVTPGGAIMIGLVAGVLCYAAVSVRPKLGYDDSLDVLGVHGAGGTWGALATGLFATTAVNSAGKNGLFYGDSSLLMKQAVAVLATYVFVFVGSAILLKAVDWTIGLRVSEEDEHAGLDLAIHGETGYDFES